ncbi:alpha/beta fold hydrolase [Arsukibacterium sp.]|uniref:alpha/beta fold hydrolase n=1 Tax=Arsukibacterium sp. TaxID=1977258 RepID=UPI00299DD26A|nr:alpha/beta fold hydrolase [Arsukibacterium sp.]MDX1536243.1 alpha/beta fold hydrolase [Arsukibacterium sp.]
MKLLLLLLSSAVLFLSVQANEVNGNKYWNAIEKTVLESGFNGTIVVGNKTQVILHKSIGYADSDNTIPITAKHLFSPGSVGKEFTTVSIMQLAKGKRLNYKDKISKYIDDLPSWANKITVEQILTHTSGLPDVKWKRDLNTTDVVQQIKQAQLAFEPGTRYKYTNLNVVVRALIVESITGQRYADYVADTIFKIAGMTDSFHQTENELASKKVVSGDFPTNVAGLTIYVTPLDLFKFENALWSDSLINTEQIKQVLLGDTLSGKDNRAYFDFGEYWLDDSRNLISWQHDGSNPSHHTLKHHDFITGNIFILMSSDGNKATLYKLLNELKNHVLPTLPEPKKPSQTTANEVAITFTADNGKNTDAYTGSFQVPENRNKPDSRLLTIHYVRFPSLSDKPAAPIVYLAGGPGGSGISTAKGRRFELFMALRQHADVIALDQRGTGLSDQVAPCQSGQLIDPVASWNEQKLTKVYQQALAECTAFWQGEGADILGYTTVQNALDINDLRKHLQAEKVSLWGISYGSHLALAAIKLFADKLDKVILASAEGLDQTVKLPQHTDAYFAALQRVVDEQPALKSRYPELVAMMKRVLQKLNTAPVLVKVASDNGRSTEILFQKLHLQLISSMLIADPGRSVSLLLELYRSLDQGETDVLQFALQQGFFSSEPIKMRIMPTAMDIASGISDRRLQQFKQQSASSLLGGVLNFPMPHLLGQVPELDLGGNFRQPLSSDVPALLLSGTLDGRTYLAEQVEAVAGLTQLSQVVVEHAGHNLLMASPEVETAILQFLAEGKTDTKRITLPLPNFGM